MPPAVPSSATTRNPRAIRWVVFVVPFLVWGVMLVAWDPAFWSFVYDDSFYYWQIARNLAAGQGPTFDGLHPTNGYHPLWLGLCTALFAAGFEGESAARASVLVQLALFTTAFAMLSSAIQRLRLQLADGPVLAPGLVAVAITSLALVHPVARVWINGLESAVAVLLHVALLSLAMGRDLLAPAERRARILAGLLIAGAFLARTDAALLLPATALWALPRLWRRPGPTTRALLEWLLCPSLVVVAFMAYNYVAFGGAIQVSGLLKAAPLHPLRLLGTAAVLIGVWAFARWFPSSFVLTRTLLGRTGFFGLFAALTFVYYCFLQVFPRLWYFGPVVLIAVAVGICVLVDLWRRAKAERPTVPERQATRPLAMVFGTIAVLAVSVGLWQAINAPNAAPLWANREAGRYIAARLPRNAVLAAWDAGVLGFYSERSVINLDGSVNSMEYLRALKCGTTAHLLAAVPVGWIINHADLVGGARSLNKHARRILGPRADRMRLVTTWPFSVFGGINQARPTANKMQVYLFELRKP
jgi:hypothetical protein